MINASKIGLWLAAIALCLPSFVFCQEQEGAQQEEQPQLSIWLRTSAEAICLKNPFFAFIPQFTDDGTFGSPRTFLFEYSENGEQWTYLWRSGHSYTQRPENLKEGWYRATALLPEEDGKEDRKMLVSEPIYVAKEEGGCTPFANPFPDEISENVCTDGILLFREDFGGNSPEDPITSPTQLTTMSSRYYQQFNIISSPSSGRYVVAKHGWQNGLNVHKTDNLFSQWFVQDDHTYPNDYTRGYLLEVDGKGGNDAFYTTTIPVCHELDLSFSAYVANVLEPGHNFAKPKVRFCIQDEESGDIIFEQSSGPIAPAPRNFEQDGYGYATVRSAPWHLVGASFHVPEGVSTLRLSIFNDENSGMGNDFALDDIEIRLCNSSVVLTSEPQVCMDSAYRFTADITTGGGFSEPYSYFWQYASDSLAFDSEEWVSISTDADFGFDHITLADSGWYRLSIAPEGVDVASSPFCRATSQPFHLTVNDCTPPCPKLQTVYTDTIVCDTLMPYRWHDTLFTTPATYEIMHRDTNGCDSLLCIYTLQTETCCPNLRSITLDTIVCDTVMPYLWHDTLFAEPATYEIMHKNRFGCDSLLCKYTLSNEICCPDLQYITHDTTVCDTLLPIIWRGLTFEYADEMVITMPNVRGCDSIQHIYTLDTIHCERLWIIIVNKYNWQLLCDNVALRRYFPGRSARAFQWYKNDEPVAGATEDDYAEQNELHGVFQLRVTLDDGEVIWSNIIEIADTEQEQYITKRIFDSRGQEVSEEQVKNGIYLYRYEQGGKVWTEKKRIP